MPDSGASRNLWDHWIQTLVTGIFAILPLALTIAVLAWVIRFLHDLAGPQSACGRVLRSIGMTVTGCEITAYIFGVLGTVLLVYGLGFLIENRVGQRWSSAFNRALQQTPILSTLYDASKNLTSVFDRRKDSLHGMTPVLCRFGDDGAATIPALMPTQEVIRVGGHDCRVVIVPTAPVPFGGALLYVKAEWVEVLPDCSFDEMVALYMSMGTSAPKCLKGDRDSEPAAPTLPGNV
jgi:uncharacterized membrane protein